MTLVRDEEPPLGIRPRFICEYSRNWFRDVYVWENVYVTEKDGKGQKEDGPVPVPETT